MKKIIIGALVFGAIIGAALLFEKSPEKKFFELPKEMAMTMEDASRDGEAVVKKILVQMNSSVGQSADSERGDVIVVGPEDREYSPAETSGFFTVKIRMTGKQAELLIAPLQKMSERKSNETDTPEFEIVRQRRFGIYLEKVGILPEEKTGREIDGIFGWDVIREK